jgi:hypothetical protein
VRITVPTRKSESKPLSAPYKNGPSDRDVNLTDDLHFMRLTRVCSDRTLRSLREEEKRFVSGGRLVCDSVVLYEQFKVGSIVTAYGAFQWGFIRFKYVATVTAFPLDDRSLLEHLV